MRVMAAPNSLHRWLCNYKCIIVLNTFHTNIICINGNVGNRDKLLFVVIFGMNDILYIRIFMQAIFCADAI